MEYLVCDAVLNDCHPFSLSLAVVASKAEIEQEHVFLTVQHVSYRVYDSICFGYDWLCVGVCGGGLTTLGRGRGFGPFHLSVYSH